MTRKAAKILLTGAPGCGKTTAVMKILQGLGDLSVVGFYTEEIRTGELRQGFNWKRLDGPEGVLAHVDIKSAVSVGRYRVDVATFEDKVLPVLDPARSDAQLFVIDEIGKMECLSQDFVWAVRRLLSSPRAVLATVARKGVGLIEEVKQRGDIQLMVVNKENREAIVAEVIGIIRGTL